MLFLIMLSFCLISSGYVFSYLKDQIARENPKFALYIVYPIGFILFTAGVILLVYSFLAPQAVFDLLFSGITFSN
jgi:hypothetical protein